MSKSYLIKFLYIVFVSFLFLGLEFCYIYYIYVYVYVKKILRKLFDEYFFLKYVYFCFKKESVKWLMYVFKLDNCGKIRIEKN